MGDCPEAKIGKTVDWAAQILEQNGCQDTHLDAELLLGHMLGWSRAQLLAHPERTLTEAEQGAFFELLRRRADREPLAHILGHWEFRGLDLAVNTHVLIPRPETELLVDLAKTFLMELWLRRGGTSADRPLVVVDVGTGSGAIAISIAVEMPQVIVHATDLSPEALAVAALNCRRHGVIGRVVLEQADLLSRFQGRIDIIVANLPYVRRDELPTLAPEISRYEPALALDGGRDGLRLVSRLLEQAGQYIEDEGAIWLEIGADQGDVARELAQQAFPNAQVSLHQDYAGRDRVVGIQL